MSHETLKHVAYAFTRAVAAGKTCGVLDRGLHFLGAPFKFHHVSSPLLLFLWAVFQFGACSELSPVVSLISFISSLHVFSTFAKRQSTTLTFRVHMFQTLISLPLSIPESGLRKPMVTVQQLLWNKRSMLMSKKPRVRFPTAMAAFLTGDEKQKRPCVPHFGAR